MDARIEMAAAGVSMKVRFRDPAISAFRLMF